MRSKSESVEPKRAYNGIVMRRLVSIAAFALLLSVPLWAQRGGGHGGSGGHGGFGGGGHAGSGGGHFSSGARGVSSFHGAQGFSRGFNRASRSFSRGPYLHDGFRRNHFRGERFRHDRFDHDRFRFRNNCNGYRCAGGYGYPFWGSAYYDPWWSWNQDDQQFNDDYYGQYDMANRMNEQSLEQERMLRQEQTDGDQDTYAARAPERRSMDPASSVQPQGSPIIPPTVLVFRDQHRQEAQNYAIVGPTLWNFTSQRTEKIALASLDLPATEKANEDRGVSFRIPGNAAGQ